jgi:hypothetical protein
MFDPGSVLYSFYTAILSKYLADKNMQTATPATTGVKRMFISFVLEVPTEKPVMAMSPITRPKVPASVASSPIGIIWYMCMVFSKWLIVSGV